MQSRNVRWSSPRRAIRRRTSQTVSAPRVPFFDRPKKGTKKVARSSALRLKAMGLERPPIETHSLRSLRQRWPMRRSASCRLPRRRPAQGPGETALSPRLASYLDAMQQAHPESQIRPCNASTPQRLNASTPQRLNDSTHQRVNAPTRQRTNASTHQRVNAPTRKRYDDRFSCSSRIRWEMVRARSGAFPQARLLATILTSAFCASAR